MVSGGVGLPADRAEYLLALMLRGEVCHTEVRTLSILLTDFADFAGIDVVLLGGESHLCKPA